VNSPEPTAEARLTELEGRYLELERLVDQLNEVLVEHTELLTGLQRENADLKELVQGLDKQDPQSEPPPPHY